MIPTYVIIPVLLAAFVMLAGDHYMLNPVRPVWNIRFLMMILAILLMIADLVAGAMMPWLSIPIFALALVWLAISGTLFWRRMATR